MHNPFKQPTASQRAAQTLREARLLALKEHTVSEHYFTAADGVGRANKGETSDYGKNPASLGLLTFCVLVLRNGFTVTGESVCASPENFDAEIYRKIARQNAVRTVRKYWTSLIDEQARDEALKELK